MPTITVDIAILIIYTLIVGGGFWEARGWKDNSAIYEAKDKQEIAVVTKERNDQIITNGVSNAYEKNVSTLNFNYDAAIRSLYAIPSVGLPSVSNSPGGTNAAPCTAKLSRSTEKSLIDLEKEADLQAEELRALQDWVRKQGMAK